jgi:GxxExxY protein
MSDAAAPSPEYPESDLTYRIIQAALAVFDELGAGFLEVIYCRALAMALRDQDIPAEGEPEMPVFFRGRVVGKFYPDMVVDGRVLVEVKAQTAPDSYSEAQLLNYLKAAGGGVGLLLNFGRRLDYKRRVVGDPHARLPNLRPPRDEATG